jgi:P27 family predicted phage terminase small subunit
LKLLHGNPGRRPVPVQVVVPTAGADCPGWLSVEGRREWRRLRPELERLGLLKQIDRGALAAYCEVWADFVWSVKEIRRQGRVTKSGNGTLMAHPAVQIQAAALKQLRAYALEFGFTPAARKGLHFPGPDDPKQDEDARFFGPKPAPEPHNA